MTERTSRIRIDWFHHAVLAATCLAESAIVWLIVDAIVASADESRGAPFWIVAALIWFAALLPALLDALDSWDVAHRLATSAGIVITAAIAIKSISFPTQPFLERGWVREALQSVILRPNEAVVSVWVPILLAAYAWWRGMTRSEPSVDSVFRLLRGGIAALLCGAIALAAVRDDTGDSAIAVGVFVIAALAAVGLVRLKQGESGGLGLSPRSIMVALLPVALVVVLGVIVTGLLSRDLVETVLWALSPLIWALGVIVRAIVLTVALFALLLMTPIFWLIEGRNFEPTPIQTSDTGLSNTNLLDESSDRAAQMPDAIRYLIAAAVLFLIFQGVTRFVLRRRRNRSPLQSDEERTTLRPVFDLRAWLAALMGGLGRDRSVQPVDPLTALRGDPKWAATVRIRERYRDLLVWSSERGAPRMAGSTPREHGASVSERVARGAIASDVDLMATLYEGARYGSEPAATADADAIEAAWRRINAAASTKE